MKCWSAWWTWNCQRCLQSNKFSQTQETAALCNIECINYLFEQKCHTSNHIFEKQLGTKCLTNRWNLDLAGGHDTTHGVCRVTSSFKHRKNAPPSNIAWINYLLEQRKHSSNHIFERQFAAASKQSTNRWNVDPAGGHDTTQGVCSEKRYRNFRKKQLQAT